ncbi:SDR family oxidoreductase [Pseudactinotalea sp. Z1732]|uniref:SDR family oxidoreductase n=1 Tax=Micrococcales TaxID=85006 RepID=UPI003C7E95F2
MPVAIVTGASRGIGAHLVRALVSANWQVVALARDTGRLQDLAADVGAATGAPTPAVLPIGCDVTDADQVSAAVGQALQTFGQVDLLVNNAGLNHREAPLWEVDAQEWWQVLTTNVKGPYLLTREVVPHMIASGGGRIVNINSGSGVRDNAESSGYNASKSALFRITGATALAGTEHGIFAFDLAPGVVRTDMTAVMAAHADRTEWTSPEEVARLCLALAGGELDAYSGRMVRAGADTVAELRARAGHLPTEARRLRLVPWGEDDPLA